MGVRRIVRARPTTPPLARFGRGAGGEGFHPVTPSPRHPVILRRAFTLVEMLTVIVIIGILASLITAAVIHARAGVKVFTVRKEISDLQQALEAYKIKYGEYPPDFASFIPMGSLPPAARIAVVRHLRNAFPRYLEDRPVDYDGSALDAWSRFEADLRNNYGLDATKFDAATALVFWLGGLPEQLPAAGEKWIPAGFHADKARPFQPGAPRTEPFFSFNGERLLPWPGAQGGFACFPPSIDQTPYVYFRARRDAVTGRFEYGAVIPTTTTFFLFSYRTPSGDMCYPYMDGYPGDPAVLSAATTDRPWCERQKYQIITAGMDNSFGQPSERWRDKVTGLGITNADFDNITSFADGKLEDAMPK